MEPCSAVGVDGRLPGWMAHLRSNGLAERSIEKYAEGLKQFVTWCRYKKTEVEAVGWEFLEEWIRHLRDAKRAATTINCKLQAVGSFYDYLMRLGKIAHNPRSDVRSLKVVRKVPQYFTEQTTSGLLDKVKKRLDLAVLEMLYGCGLRNAELCGINTEDVLWDQAMIRVTGKGSRERMVPIPITCLEAIKAWLPDRAKRLKGGKRSKPRPRTDALFLNKYGRRFQDESVRLIVQRAAKVAGVERRVYPHLFRHTYATHMYNNGADILALRELLGHQHVQTTEIYTHVAYKKLAATVSKYHPRPGSGCQAEN